MPTAPESYFANPRLGFQVYPVSKLNIANLQTGEIVDPYSPNYAIRQPLPIYRALCPAHAPI